jgi:hypothetical protein
MTRIHILNNPPVPQAQNMARYAGAMGESSRCALRKLGAKGLLPFSHGQNSKDRFLNTPPVPYPLTIVRFAWESRSRPVARRGGEAEFRAVLGFTGDSKRAGCVISDDQSVSACRNFISTLIFFCGDRRAAPRANGRFVDGDKSRNCAITSKTSRKRVLHGRFSSLTLLQNSPCVPMIIGDPVPVPSAIYKT